jgi:hypothetical protein
MAAYSLRALLILLALVAIQPQASAQAAQRIPAGRRAANEATRQAEKLEPPAAPAQNISAADVLQQANELLSLAQQVHTDAEHATQGMISKDLKDKLKRIEKLSKRLRDELNL